MVIKSSDKCRPVVHSVESDEARRRRRQSINDMRSVQQQLESRIQVIMNQDGTENTTNLENVVLTRKLFINTASERAD
ncbi:exodeoxyribonuclease 7 small subunit [Acrasis kona]|uniref:Exodeoxyribonuclease 7 small subunit n=1 Tax=Acrasis kona TaxID=1008807 RepID=A0AAW2Z3E3_9EUKA